MATKPHTRSHGEWTRTALAAWTAWAVLAIPASCSSESAADPRAAASPERSEPESGAGALETTPAPTEGAASDGAFRTGVEHVLLLGFDGPMSPPGRTDAILILAIDSSAGEIGVVSVPRDLWVDIPGLEPGRINTVFRIGEARLGAGTGHALLKAILARELGIQVEHTIAVDMEGFGDIVDLMGGVTVDVDCPIQDNFASPDSPTGYEPLSLETGRQRLDGHTALLYSRSRHGRSDLDRARRQQAVLIGLWRKVARFETVGRLPALWKKIAKHVRTDLDLAAALELAALLAGVGLDDLHGLVLAEPIVYQWRSPDGRSVLRLDREKLRAALDGLFEAPKPGKRFEACRAADAALRWKEKRGARAPDAGP
jgi:polyisoprenyl-teichoic acid--peptidoglycan teichoic acid transferase